MGVVKISFVKGIIMCIHGWSQNSRNYVEEMIQHLRFPNFKKIGILMERAAHKFGGIVLKPEGVHKW